MFDTTYQNIARKYTKTFVRARKIIKKITFLKVFSIFVCKMDSFCLTLYTNKQ